VSIEDRFASALSRIASATSVIRTRSLEAERAQHNGNSNGDLRELVTRLERVAKRLEDAIA
jgi:Mg2+ and Co2+ transporter CorA